MTERHHTYVLALSVMTVKIYTRDTVAQRIAPAARLARAYLTTPWRPMLHSPRPISRAPTNRDLASPTGAARYRDDE